MTIENLKQIAIKYATTKGSRVPLAPDELCNAVVQYFNEFLKITADINTIQVAVTEEGGNIVFTITGNTLDGKAFTPIVITVDRNGFVTNQEFEEFKTTTNAAIQKNTESINSLSFRVEDTENDITTIQVQVDGLYTLLEQKNEIYVQTATDTYTTRETAGGENIADGVQTPVKKITGKTVKTTNLIPYPYYETPKTVNGVTWNVNNDGTITINGTATELTTFLLFANNKNLPAGISVGGIYTISLKGGSNDCYIYTNYVDSAGEEHGAGLSSNTGNTPTNTVGEEWKGLQIYIAVTQNATLNNVTVYPMLNEGSTAKPYIPYFPGLKNAFFKEIVSTGRNLIDLSGVSLEKTVNGVTFTKISDGLYRVTGTIADPSQGTVSTVNINQGKVYPAGVYSIARYTVDGKDIEFFVSAYSAKTGASIRNIDRANININEDFVIRSAGIYVNKAITGAIDLTVSTMLNYGSSALPYEPYTQSVLSLPEAVELTEYDTAYPETGEIQKQSNTVTFDGTEDWYYNTNPPYTVFYASIFAPNNIDSICNIYERVTRFDELASGKYIIWSENVQINDSRFSTVEEWKAHLAALSEAGNPLTVTYKTAEVQSTEQADFSADSYIAWKNGSETIEQGYTDNSIYGAENTVEQDYYLLTAPDIPDTSSFVTLAGNNTFTGVNTFNNSIYAKNGVVVVAENTTNYGANSIIKGPNTYSFPNKSGTFAMTTDVIKNPIYFISFYANEPSEPCHLIGTMMSKNSYGTGQKTNEEFAVMLADNLYTNSNEGLAAYGRLAGKDILCIYSEDGLSIRCLNEENSEVDLPTVMFFVMETEL